MLQHDSVLPSTLSSKPRLVEVSRRIPVLIPEDSLLRWKGLNPRMALDADLLVLRGPASMTDILTHCAKLKPCILLIDQSGIEQLDPQKLAQTLDFGRAVSALVKVSRDDPETLKRLLRLGCMGFVTERSSAAIIVRAIDALSRGEIWASRRLLSDFVRMLLASPNPQSLTPREDQILRLIARGMSNREITEELFISRETVRWHIRTLYAKIGVKNRQQAAEFAAREHPEAHLQPEFSPR